MNVRIRYRLAALALLLSTSSLMGDDEPKPTTTTPEITPFLVPSLEEKFASEASKADAITAKAEAESAKLKKQAADARLKGYKEKLAEITKTGDFDKAQQVKARITQLENDPDGEYTKPEKPTKRPRPKDTVKFGGHTYALIKEPATWHVAKQRCEEMGGHLVSINNTSESEFVAKLCGQKLTSIGVSDELEEGVFLNVDGSKPVFAVQPTNSGISLDHWVVWDGNRFVVWQAGGRATYVCEWDR